MNVKRPTMADRAAKLSGGPMMLRRGRGAKGAGLIGLAVGASLASSAAMAQDTPNPLLTFGFSSSLNASDNYDLSVDSPGSSTFLDNTLSLAYETQTDVQTLRFNASGVARLADLPEQDAEARFDNQTVGLEYGLEGANSRLQLRGRYNRAELAFFDPLSLLDLPDPIDGEDLLTDNTGYRETLSLGASFQTGLAGPLSFSLSANTLRRDFIDTVDEDLFNTVTDSISSSVGAQVTPVTQMTLSASVSHYQAEDDENTDRLSSGVSLGVAQELARAMTLTGAIGYQVIDTEKTDIFGQDFTTREEGITGSAGLSQQLTNGSIGLSASHAISVNGTRSALVFSRDMDLPDGSLSLSLGGSKGEVGHASWIGDISYAHETPLGRFLFALSRDVRTGSDDEELEITRAQASWSRNLTAVSSLGLNLDYLDTNSVIGTQDRERSRFRASYNHALTEDWNLSSGYEYTLSKREGRGDAQENSVFLTLGRSFQFRP